MSFFRPEIPIVKEKVISHHPWEKHIKDTYTSTYKYGHNSVHNPVYPPKKEKVPHPNRMKFTVIGNRITKEFIYCINLVKGLHKYRWKQFDAPIIRGVTSVEWPKVWNDLKIQYGGVTYCLENQVAILLNDQILGGDKELKELVESKYSYHICPDYYKEAVSQFSSYIKSSGRPCAYLQVSADNENVGTMIFMLYADIVPRTCENFLRLCQATKGGYSGTPIHRIVTDCWIQCGGYGLKDTDLDCENFIVPHDRRGVLCMANNGRHVDCSTQFFVLLQPAQWMAFKYVAFGQLIEGEETLHKIEQVPTWYESPTKNIIIYKAGAFNMDCQNIAINKKANEYIQGHIENLFTVGELFYEELLAKVFLKADFRSLQRMQDMMGEGSEEVTPEEVAKNIRATQRFMRNKEEIDKQLEKGRGQSTPAAENNDFDVEEYAYEPEEYSYKHVSLDASANIPAPPEKLFYIPLTDVPYDGDADSIYDLKKVLKGDYCHKCDLDESTKKKRHADEDRLSIPSDMFYELLEKTAPDDASLATLDSDDAREIQRYFKTIADRVSFAGEIVKNMARSANTNVFESARKSELLTDEELRRIRLASMEYRAMREKPTVTAPEPTPEKISKLEKAQQKLAKRRQTGFVRPDDLEKINIFAKADSDMMIEEEEDEERKPSSSAGPVRVGRRFLHARRVSDGDDLDIDVGRPSVLARLYSDLAVEDEDSLPTLKDYKPLAEMQKKQSLFLTSPYYRLKNEESDHDRYIRRSITMEHKIGQVLDLGRHGKKLACKVSSDCFNVMDHMEQKLDNSLRSVEFARTRPVLSIGDYQKKNKQYQEEHSKAKTKSHHESSKHEMRTGGLRLPGDSPLYSDSSLEAEVPQAMK